MIVLPGVPEELEVMTRLFVLPLLVEKFRSNRCSASLLRIFGKSEAHLGELIDKLELPDQVKVSYRAVFPEVQIRLIYIIIIGYYCCGCNAV